MRNPESELVEKALSGVGEITVRSVMLGAGPRFARDAFAPPLAFYVIWRLAGLVPGIALATLTSLVSYAYERRRDRRGTLAKLSLAFVVVQAAAGLGSASASVYLAQPVLVSAAFGIGFLVSALVRRPLVGVFAEEFYPIPSVVTASATFRRIFGRCSLVWGVYLVLRSATRLTALLAGSVELFLLINVLTGIPLTAGLTSWTIWYVVTRFRESEEWGWAFASTSRFVGRTPDDVS